MLPASKDEKHFKGQEAHLSTPSSLWNIFNNCELSPTPTHTNEHPSFTRDIR